MQENTAPISYFKIESKYGEYYFEKNIECKDLKQKIDLQLCLYFSKFIINIFSKKTMDIYRLLLLTVHNITLTG